MFLHVHVLISLLGTRYKEGSEDISHNHMYEPHRTHLFFWKGLLGENRWGVIFFCRPIQNRVNLSAQEKPPLK